jgi:hypothetical protein
VSSVLALLSFEDHAERQPAWQSLNLPGLRELREFRPRVLLSAAKQLLSAGYARDDLSDLHPDKEQPANGLRQRAGVLDLAETGYLASAIFVAVNWCLPSTSLSVPVAVTFLVSVQTSS